jgi:regulator of sirC expression with transglutaminase-like and TPR domain
MWRVAALALLLPATAFADRVDNEALGHLDRGVAAYRLADYATARRELDAAVELVPDRANPYRWRALTELAQHDCATAVVDIESFLSRVPAGDDRIAELATARDRCVTTTRVAAAPTPAPPSQAEPAFYDHWWFWTAVGAVALTGAGVAYGVTRHDETTLPIVHCTDAGCR